MTCTLSQTARTRFGKREIHVGSRNGMTQRSTSYWLRWFMLPVALPALMCLSLAGLQAAFHLHAFNLWHQSLAGGITAAFWIVATCVIAPSQRMTTCSLSFLVGAALAWFLIGKSHWPDYSGTTRLATYITWVSGLCTLGAIAFVQFRQKRTQPEVGQVSSEAAPSASPDEPST
jgi:hypothetical protein